MGAIAMGAIVSKKGVRALAHFILRGNLPVCHSKLKKRSGNRLRTLTSPCIGQSRNISRARRSFLLMDNQDATSKVLDTLLVHWHQRNGKTIIEASKDLNDE